MNRKTYISVIIVLVFLTTAFLLSTRSYQIKAQNTKTRDNSRNIYDDTNEIASLNMSKSFDYQKITSLKDITDTMIIKKETGFQAAEYSLDAKDNGFIINSDTFTGVDYCKVINADQKNKVTFKYSSTMDLGTYKLLLIPNNKKVVEIPSDKSKFTYELPKGDTIVVLAGYKAHGKLSFQMNSVEGVEFMNDDVWDEEEATIDSKDITSLKDITNKMILKKEAGFNAVGYGSNLIDNGFAVSSGRFTGVLTHRVA